MGIADIRVRIAQDLADGISYDLIAGRLGVNKGIVWQLHHHPGYRPTVATLHKLGIRKEDRNRFRVDLGRDLGERVTAYAAARGFTAQGLTLSDLTRDVWETWLSEER